MSSSLTPKFNLTYMDQVTYLDGYHRSGWAYVMGLLMSLHDDRAKILLDTYVDRTFHWNKPSFLPYKKSWVGIVHHTFDTSFSSYNNVVLLENPLFVQSLDMCKGLYVFSESIASQWRTVLTNKGFGNIPIQSLVHPTEFVSNNWTVDKLKGNANRHLVQIGAWLRDNYTIYKLNNGKPVIDIGDELILHKAALKGQNMDYYFKPNNFFRLLRPPAWKNQNAGGCGGGANVDTFQLTNVGQSIISANAEIPNLQPSQPDQPICRDLICRDSSVFLNKYVEGAVGLLQQYDNSVVIIPQMDNVSYDDLLSKNIVFLKLWDAAAVNTIVECIVRNTPIVVNPLPAVVELLGQDYPLYFESIDNTDSVVTLSNIVSAYNYLYSMDKSKFEGHFFLQSIVNGPIYIPLHAANS